MKENATASDYIRLAAKLCESCYNLTGRDATRVQWELDDVVSLLSSDGLDFKQAKTHDEYLRNVSKWIQGQQERPEGVKGIPDNVATDLGKTADTIFRSLYAEANARFLVTLDRSAASDRLRAVDPQLVEIQKKLATAEQQNLIVAQRVLVAEAVRCLETGAYRAAMVMAWNLTYEYVRQWIFVDPARLKQFNDVLTQKYRNKTDRYDAITDYAGFFRFGEAYVLDLANEAKLLEKHAYRTLTEALNNRNQYAHPTFLKADRDIAVGYISNLIANVITQPEFRYFA